MCVFVYIIVEVNKQSFDDKPHINRRTLTVLSTIWCVGALKDGRGRNKVN